ncbi:MAG: hypothetical protein V1906_00705 [Candidatus Woesearchaeota archaeon]
MESEIKYIGIDNLDELEASELKSLVERNAPKVERHLHKHQKENMSAKIRISVKKINHGDKKKHFLIKMYIASTTGKFEVEHSDWDLARTMHKIFESINNIVKKELKQK